MVKFKSYKVIALSIILLLGIVYFIINSIFVFNRGFSIVDLYITHKVVNIKSYGAKLDGKHYDNKALNDAISSIKEGTVYIPRGTLLIPDNVTITVPKGINITGAGFDKTKIKQFNGYPSNKIFNCMGRQKIQGVTIDSKLGIKPSGDNIEILKCKFTKGVQSIQVADTVNKLIIRKCVFNNNSGYGILFNRKPSYDCLIEDCEFVNTTGDFIEINSACKRIIIENCTFKDNHCTSSWAGFAIGVAVKAKQISINNCSFSDIYGQGIHIEDYAEASITNCDFKNCGSAFYGGSPKSDIAVLSNAKVHISECIHYQPDDKYSKIGVFCTGGIALASDCTYYKRVNYGLRILK
ncbi:glycoside hydrolase family 55 protein [Clostridium algoriphilum]|uniref:glycosyl hydrolase family 28-related protein n=1 Tax=Clostridium algoriphilum TaxID=198347 RepID=UPI001CF520BB|nr:right-handed parallel beta-helix repeat-containing protein [Clostridium algoriphilum]MCB2295336.1 glycoside hydrolase family 55 protein [Clostridium algoriphilum]